MTRTMTDVVKQGKYDGTTPRDPAAMVAICRRVGDSWRERCLHPVKSIGSELIDFKISLTEA